MAKVPLRKSPLYGGCQMLSPDGTHLANVSRCKEAMLHVFIPRTLCGNSDSVGACIYVQESGGAYTALELGICGVHPPHPLEFGVFIADTRLKIKECRFFLGLRSAAGTRQRAQA